MVYFAETVWKRVENIIEKLYPDTRPKKKSRRSSGAAPPSPTGGDSSSDSD